MSNLPPTPPVRNKANPQHPKLWMLGGKHVVFAPNSNIHFFIMCTCLEPTGGNLQVTHLTWGPGQLSSTQNMNMDMVHLLSSLTAIINHYAKPFGQVLFSCNFFGN